MKVLDSESLPMRWVLPPVWREIVFCNSLYPSERAHYISPPHLLLGVQPCEQGIRSMHSDLSDLGMFRFIIMLASCFMKGKPMRGGDFTKFKAELGLLIGPLYKDCPHHGALPYIEKPHTRR